jgi:hypothetical protein
LKPGAVEKVGLSFAAAHPGDANGGLLIASPREIPQTTISSDPSRNCSAIVD